MISSLRAATPHQPRKANPTPTSSAPSTQTVPQDSVDFSKIDSPVKAALVPINEPAVQMALTIGLLNLLQAAKAAGGGVPLVIIEASIKAADKLSNVSYQIDLKNKEAMLSATGDVGGQPLTEGLKANTDKSQHLAGSIGKNATDLLVVSTAKARSARKAKGAPAAGAFRLDGNIGDVETHLTYSLIGGAKGLQGVHVEGTLGGQAYSADNLLDEQAAGALLPSPGSAPKEEDEPAKGDPTEAEASEGGHKHAAPPPAEPAGTMTVNGKLGDQVIVKDYTLTAQQVPGGIDIGFSGKGVLAGVKENVLVTMHLIA